MGEMFDPERTFYVKDLLTPGLLQHAGNKIFLAQDTIHILLYIEIRHYYKPYQSSKYLKTAVLRTLMVAVSKNK